MKTFFAFLTIFALSLPTQAQQISWLGISLEDGKDGDVSIRSIELGGPAAQAGLKPGDVILEFNKTLVTSSVQLTRLVRETSAGRGVEVKIRRDNRDQTLQVITGTPQRIAGLLRNDRFFDMRDWPGDLWVDAPSFEMSMSVGRAGIRVDTMTTQLQEFFGITTGNGVLVTSVDRGSLGEKAGLKAGDVVIAVDNRNVQTPADFDHGIRQSSNKIALRVVREKREIDITLDRTPDSH